MNNILDDYFFFIDSNNFDMVESRCYGYSISKKDNELIFNDYNCNNTICGSYIHIKKEKDKIHIVSDDISSLYIFYYIDDSYYAISNSFYKLCEELKYNGKHISINKVFIEQYLQSALHVQSLFNTLINEIHILPIFTDIELTKETCKFIKKDINMQSIDIDSKEGSDIINNWINKWASIIYSFSTLNFPFQIDLSGGFDSRVIFSLSKYSGIDLNGDNIKIYSKIGKTKGLIQHLGDDYDIANKIANTLKFQLNKKFKNGLSISKYSSKEQYEILKNCYMGFHKEGYLSINFNNIPTIHLGGVNGEMIRGSLPSEEDLKTRFNSNPIKKSDNVLNEFYKDLSLLENESKTYFEALTKFFFNNQARTHFGMSIYNDYIKNTYLISPFNDKELLKLGFKDGVDKNLIFAIIIYKCCPEIFNIDFAHNKCFNEKTKTLAKEISNKYPLKQNIVKYNINKQSLYKHIENQNSNDSSNGEYVLYQIFKENKELFINKFGELFDTDYAEKIYQHANNFYLNKDNFYPNTWIVCLTSIIEVFKIIYE